MAHKNFLKRVYKFLRARYSPRGARISFAGSGEDIIMFDVLNKMGINKVFYIDIGSHNPIFGNNTYLFYKNSGNGVLVEPNKDLCELTMKKRPRDLCINAGVGKVNGRGTFFKFSRNTRNTFSSKEAEAWENISGDKARLEERAIISLDSIIETHCGGKAPDLISIDTEGSDLDILMGFSWSKRPKIFCVEVAASSQVLSKGNYESDLVSFMDSHNYKKLAMTPVNIIFIDNLDKNLTKNNDPI